MPYHVQVMFSGGKDSAYLLYLLEKKYNLRILAFSVIHPFVNSLAQENMERVTKQLNIDFIKFHVDEQMMKCYMRYGLLEGQKYGINEHLCTLCGAMYKQIGLKMAIHMKIPYLMNGHAPTQEVFLFFYPGPDIAEWCLNKKMFGQLHQLFSDACGDDYQGSIYDFHFEEFKDSPFPIMISPFSFIEYDCEHYEIELEKQGILERDAIRPQRTNCDLLHFFSYFSFKRYHCYPYTKTFAVGLRSDLPTLLDQYLQLEAKLFNREEHLMILADLQKITIYAANHPEVTTLDLVTKESLALQSMEYFNKAKFDVINEIVVAIQKYRKYFDIDLSKIE